MEINPPPNPEKLGGKAFQLYRLREICRVPPFFVLSFDSTSEIEDADVQHSIRQLWDDSGFTVAAVRSSASVEDSASRSFAGIFESILGVSADNLIGAVEKVLKSVQSDRVQSYMEAHGISVPRIRMNVIVQELLAARTAGVSFTRLDQSKNQVVVEACFGLGEALVSGKVSPDTYFVNRDDLSIEQKKIAYQSNFLALDETGAASYQQVPFFKKTAQKLSDREIKDVAELALSIEYRLSLFPADVEWAFEGDALFALQARRFTGVPDPGSAELTQGLGPQTGETF